MIGNMGWRAGLEGEPLDLDALVEQLASETQVRVVRDCAGVWLEGTALDSSPDSSSAYAAARELLPVVNGAAVAHDSGFRPVRLSDVVTDGSVRHVFASARLEGRSRLTASLTVHDAEGNAITGPSVRPALAAAVEAATRAPVVREALALLSQPELGWFQIYKLYEILKEDVDLTTLGSAADWKALTASANKPNVSGDAARHARGGAGIPKRTMTLGEAQTFIKAAVAKWCRAK